MMNKRIQELIQQCEHTTQHSYAVGDGTFEVHHFDKEKFAELIVRECARVAIQKQTENDLDNIVSKNPAKDFAYALIKHFGIEE
jgi:hypothetical protein